jgi:hypothetical protein
MKKRDWRDKIESFITSFIAFLALVGMVALTLWFFVHLLRACVWLPPPSTVKCPSHSDPRRLEASSVGYSAASGMDWNDDGWICQQHIKGDRYSISDNWIVAPTLTPPPPAKGLFIQGTILDADTGRGIPGAAYIVLNPGITVDSWDGSDDQGYAWAQADANGYFELPRPLERNQRYSIIIWAEGYLPAGGDDILVSDEPSPLQVEITLQRE